MTAKTYKQRIKDAMNRVGTYKPEFDKTITILAQLYEDMDKAREQFDASGGKYIVKHTNKNGSSNMIKNPYYLVIEGLQDKALRYAGELGLTPAGLKKINSDGLGQQKQSKLDQALYMLG